MFIRKSKWYLGNDIYKKKTNATWKKENQEKKVGGTGTKGQTVEKKGHEWEIQNRTICMDGLQWEKKTAGYEAEKKIEKLTRMGYLGKHKRTQVDEENGLIDQSSDSIYCLFYFI